LKEKMMVVRVENDFVVLKSEDEESCHACPLHSICKVDPERYTLKVPKEKWDVEEGDTVVIKTPRAPASRIALVLYTIPLLIFVSILVVSKSFGLSDLFSFLFSLLGLAVYYTITRAVDTKLKKKFSPKIVEVLKQEDRINSELL